MWRYYITGFFFVLKFKILESFSFWRRRVEVPNILDFHNINI